MWDLSSPICDLACSPVLEAQSVNDWTTREVPSCMFLEEAARFCKVGGEGMKRRYQR